MSFLNTIITGSISGLVVLFFWSWWQSRSTEFHTDTASLNIMKLAIGLLPEEQREDYYEQWWWHLVEQENFQKRLLEAFGMLKAASAISYEERIVVPVLEKIIATQANATNAWMLLFNTCKSLSKFRIAYFIADILVELEFTIKKHQMIWSHLNLTFLILVTIISVFGFMSIIFGWVTNFISTIL